MSHPTAEDLRREAKTRLDEILALGRPLKAKERMAIPPQDMPAQHPVERARNTSEVALGYSPEQARLEAMRCLQCRKAPCVGGCPVAIDIPRFVQAVADGDFAQAIAVIKENSLLPAVCGRVCPQETQCQEPCTVGMALKDPTKSVAIGRLERFVADWERDQGTVEPPTVKPATGKKVAIIGSGPSGLVCAADVRREGHDVTIYEAFHKFGGVMLYGIPEFRLPKAIVAAEVDTLRTMGVDLVPNFVVGRTRKLMDMLDEDGFDALFIATGAGLPRFLHVEGENLVGVFSANEYLTRANLMRAYDRQRSHTPIYDSRHAVILGGGNVAMDAARTALRLGAEKVTVVYRRTQKEMPARVEEVDHAMEEGIHFHFLANAKRILGNDKGRVRAMECLRYELGEPDASGRRRPVVIPGSEFELDVDTVVVAIGNDSNPLIKQTTPHLETNRWGNILVDDSGKTNVDRVYAGGDIVLGAATVILAMGQGRRAAASIVKQLAEQE